MSKTNQSNVTQVLLLLKYDLIECIDLIHLVVSIDNLFGVVFLIPYSLLWSTDEDVDVTNVPYLISSLALYL